MFLNANNYKGCGLFHRNNKFSTYFIINAAFKNK